MLRIRALGGLSVEQDGSPVSGAGAQPRRQAILAVLARAGKRGVSRERLLALLWPDANEDSTRSVLSQAIYMLRRDLGAADAICGSRELRLDPAVIESDVAEFEELCTSGDLERAVALYTGPFLEGFRLPGNPELDRWVEAERDTLAHRYTDALEKLARGAAQRGDPLGASGWWRQLAGLDPLNARVTIELMRSLAAAGDRAGALQQARIYEALLAQDLDLAPDRAVVELARKVREESAQPEPTPRTRAVSTSDSVAPPAPVDASSLAPIIDGDAAPPAAEAAVATETPSVSQPASLPNAAHAPARAPRRKQRVAIGLLGGVALVAVGAIATLIARRTGTWGSPPVVAIGRIADYRGDAGAEISAPLTDMLATNLARSTSLRVVSSARMMEMLARARGEGDTTAVYARAARLAGASQMIEGAVVALKDGGYRLDLRRVTLAEGTIKDAETVRGADLFALADSGSAKLLATLGSEPVAGSIADVTTRSLPAYRLYMRGLQRYQAGDGPAARELFEAALGEDSTFAMAAYWAAVSISYDWRSPERRHMLAHIDRAVRLSASASDRERLIIRTWWARATNSPSLRAIADTLSRRYPEEIDGHVQAGAAAILAGDFLGAAIPLERAIRLDSVVLSTGVQRCAGCNAIDLLIRAWVAADSMAAAERVARRAVRIWPRNPISFALLAEVLDYQGRFGEAEAVIDSVAALRTSTVNMWARHWIRSGRFDRLDPMLRQHIASSGEQGSLLYWSAMSLRNQSRFDDALGTARRFRALTGEPGDTRSSAPQSAAIEAQVLLESGKAAASAALFDSIAEWRLAGQPEATYAANRVWMLTQEAAARADAGDAPAVAALADSVEALGARTYTERDRRLHHHVRGLEAMLRSDVDAAIDHFRRAIYSPTIGYNRTNYELARALLRRGRPPEAVAVLRPAARGVVLESANVHLTLADVHALMARAFAAAGQPDSARVHGAWLHGNGADASSR